MGQGNYQAICKCGSKSYIVADRKAAEVLADVHETTARVAHKHDCTVVFIAR